MAAAVAALGVAAAGYAGWYYLAPPTPPPYPIAKFETPLKEHVLPVGLHIRAGPGAGFEALPTGLAQGDEVTGIGQTAASDGGTWQYIRAKGRTFGYVNARMLAGD